MNFNKAQHSAIEHKDGAMLVLAGPGSGKTAVITHRTKNLITKHHVKPSEILVITFTKAAANEMKERFNSLMKDESANSARTVRLFRNRRYIHSDLVVRVFC
ncbi:UvrD-helicase domain-containing protein, partial [Agathobacter rectalis]|uniref:UvrD-helicase domain-containing protein n=1 Tax=Agathobacter rectalis TaxID=39491 RepID=UPI0027D32735